MEIRVRDTGQVMFESEFRAYQKSIGGPSWEQTTPEVLEALGADPVLEGPQPTAGRYQTAYRDGVEQVDGQWFTKYSLADMDAEAIAAKDAEQAKSVRQQRNDKLKDCDWTQLADSVADKAAWATYRQALRDVPAQAGFPWDIQWPEQPK